MSKTTIAQNDVKKSKRLPIAFHNSFMPERDYIHKMLSFAAKGLCGNISEISEQTGIPTGQYTGKVSPIIAYCKAMNLIEIKECYEYSSEKKIKKRFFELTPFGRILFLQDPYLNKEVSQFICHFNMCSPLTGAELWYQVFFKLSNILGNSFSRETLQSNIRLTTIDSNNDDNIIITTSQIKRHTGPLFTMYSRDNSFKKCGALSESKEYIYKKTAPISIEFARGYGAWILQLISNHFSTQTQISIDDLNNIAGVMTIPNWSHSDLAYLLDLMEERNLVSVDRQMQPWLIKPKESLDSAWNNIFVDNI